MSTDALRIPVERDLREILERIRVETHVPGLGVAVSVGGRQVTAYSGQPALDSEHAFSEQSRFEMSCLMKLFSSFAVLELSDEGVLDIEQPVPEYLPEIPLCGLNRKDLRVHHLMDHTSGYRGLDVSNSQVRWNYSWDRFLQHCGTQARHFTPGSVFNYEHSEHVVLGEIVRRICGRPVMAIVHERILEPLHIHLSCVNADRKRVKPYVAQHTYAPARASFTPMSLPAFGPFWACSLPDATLTLQETLSVGEAVLAAWRSQGKQGIFSATTLAALRKPGPPLPAQVVSGLRSEEMPTSFGMGFGHYRNGLLGHNGSMFGQTCTLRIDPLQDIAIAVGVNAWVPYARDCAVSRTLALITGSKKAAEESPPAVMDRVPFKLGQMINGFSLDDIAGGYVGSYFGEVHVSRDGDAIHFDLGAEGPRRARVSAVADAFGHYTLDSSMPVAVGFFNDPADRDRPALMMGVHAYKKVS